MAELNQREIACVNGGGWGKRLGDVLVGVAKTAAKEAFDDFRNKRRPRF